MRWIDTLNLFAYWHRQPPVHELVAAYLGYKPPNDLTVEELRERSAPSGCLSIAELRRIVAANGVPA